MAQTIQKAPGKIILFGEHAVVHGQPAIAVPLPQRYASVSIKPIIIGNQQIVFVAPDIGLNKNITELPQEHPFVIITELVKEHGNLHHLPAMEINIHSTLPIASGLGSGAAISVALAKALCTFLAIPFTDQDISRMAYETEKVYHGNPSGIDNTVIAFQKGIFFQREKPIQWLEILTPFDLLIINSGAQKSTKTMVGMVSQALNESPSQYQPIIEQIGDITIQAKAALGTGNMSALGILMQQNHHCLQQLGVSTPTLDQLVTIAMQHGALGAKLCGAGGGGNMIILPSPESLEAIQTALTQSGYHDIILATIHE